MALDQAIEKFRNAITCYDTILNNFGNDLQLINMQYDLHGDVLSTVLVVVLIVLRLVL